MSSRTIPHLWDRHILDSVQLWRYIPVHSDSVIDMGSGGGFPGIVLGILSAQSDGPLIHLVESDTRKAAFLSTASHLTKARTMVHASRIETLKPQQADAVTARACAPLVTLLEWAELHLKPGGICVFPKGRTAEEEVKEAEQEWAFSLEYHESSTDPQGRILVLSKIGRLSLRP